MNFIVIDKNIKPGEINKQNIRIFSELTGVNVVFMKSVDSSDRSHVVHMNMIQV